MSIDKQGCDPEITTCSSIYALTMEPIWRTAFITDNKKMGKPTPRTPEVNPEKQGFVKGSRTKSRMASSIVLLLLSIIFFLAPKVYAKDDVATNGVNLHGGGIAPSLKSGINKKGSKRTKKQSKVSTGRKSSKSTKRAKFTKTSSTHRSKSAYPSNVPSDIPSGRPSVGPSDMPTDTPSAKLSMLPSAPPTEIPNASPSTQPSVSPSSYPSNVPSDIPSESPTIPRAWQQMVSNIIGEASGDYSGIAVSMSEDGKRLAIGAYGNYDKNEALSGHVRVYQWNNTINDWDQMGSDINGEASGDWSGRSVSMSEDGNRLAIGAH